MNKGRPIPLAILEKCKINRTLLELRDTTGSLSGKRLKHETGININISDNIIKRIFSVTTADTCNLEKRGHYENMIPRLNYFLLKKATSSAQGHLDKGYWLKLT